jgi:hypothetical protein
MFREAANVVRERPRKKGGPGATRARYRPSEKRSTDMSEQSDLSALAKKIEEKTKQKEEAKARQAKLSDNDKKRLDEIISLFNDLERHGVLSYRVEAPVEGKPRVLWFAIESRQPIIITISSNKVSFEKLQPNGNRESVKTSAISRPSELSRNNMMKLIDEILGE